MMTCPSPMFLFGLLCACSWIFAVASPIRLVSNADKSPERNASSSGSLLTRQAAVPLYERCKQAGHLAMTFDDGPYFGGQTASLLEEYGGKGTYFVNGNNWDCIYNQRRADDLIRRYKAGHVVGVHGWSHSDITTLTSEELHYQLDLIEAAFRKILGVKPRFFRPAYGTYDTKSLRILQERGYSVVLWDFDAEDAVGASPEESIANYENLLETFPASHIALNHETHEGTVESVVPTVVPLIQDAGYKLVDVGECLGIEPYQAVGAPGRRDATWTCDGTPARAGGQA